MNQILHLTEDEGKAVAEIRENLVALAGSKLKRMYLFGSKARGDYDTDSDVDIAIIVEGLDSKMKRSIINIVAGAEVKYFVVISSLVLPRSDFKLLLKRERRIARDIIREGIDLLRPSENIVEREEKEKKLEKIMIKHSDSGK